MVACWVVCTVLVMIMRIGYCVLEEGTTNISGQECTVNEDCSNEEMCANNKCVDPCIAADCGNNADCHGFNHIPMCSCSPGHTFVYKTGCIHIENECGCTNNPCADEQSAVRDVRSISDHSADVDINGKDTSCLCIKDQNNTDAAKTNYIDPEGSKSKKTFVLYNDSEMTWNQSLAHCVSLNMTLATINSQAEQDTLFDMIQGYTWWIGGSDLWDPGNYTWVSTGQPLTYSNWWPGQPNNRQHFTGEVQHCVHRWTHWPVV